MLEDWIAHDLSIPTMLMEMGDKADYDESGWVPTDPAKAMSLIELGEPLVEYLYQKVGNQISLEAKSYKKVERTKEEIDSLPEAKDMKYKAILKLNVINNGLSD